MDSHTLLLPSLAGGGAGEHSFPPRTLHLSSAQVWLHHPDRFTPSPASPYSALHWNETFLMLYFPGNPEGREMALADFKGAGPKGHYIFGDAWREACVCDTYLYTGLDGIACPPYYLL